MLFNHDMTTNPSKAIILMQFILSCFIQNLRWGSIIVALIHQATRKLQLIICSYYNISFRA